MRKRKCSLNSRKGNIVIESSMFIIVLFIFVFLTFQGSHLFSELQPEIHSGDLSNESVAVYDQVEGRYTGTFTGIILFVLLGFWSFVIISAYLSNQMPIMFIFSFILLVFVIIAAMMLGNSYEEFFSDAEYTGVTQDFAIPHWIMSHTLQISIGVMMTGLLIGLARSRSD